MRMKTLFVVTAFSLISLYSYAEQLGQSANTLPTLTMQCVNPRINVRFTSIQGTQASTEPVQFNFNIPVVRGAIFVDEKNSGVCTATISDGYQFLNGSGTVSPTQISVSSPDTPAALKSAITIFSQILGNQTMVIDVSRGASTIKGNANIYFIVKYKQD